ncbi:MAG: PAS domain-containing protein [bacterium]|nr:PAS domain-containing protein [bacterium]
MAQHGDRLRGLDDFVREARAARNLAELCALAAAAAARVTDAPHAMAWTRARPGQHEEFTAGVWGLEREPAATSSDCPSQVRTLFGADGPTCHRDVAAEQLGLVAGPPFSSVHGVALTQPGEVGCWVGVLYIEDSPQLDPESAQLLRIVAHHFSGLFEAHSSELEHRASELKHRTLVEQIPAITYYRGLDSAGAPSFMSPQVKDILGFEPDEFVEDPDFFRSHLHPDDLQRVLQAQGTFDPNVATTMVKQSFRIRHRDGHFVWVTNHALAARGEDGTPRFVIGVVFDVTETMQLEEQLRHAQKMEAVGRLAGAVAHDFNNLLTVILGFASLLASHVPEGTPGSNDLKEIVSAGERAKHLVGQLLSFSRREASHPQFVPLGALLDEMRSMIMRLIRDDVEFDYRRSPDLGGTRIDRSQLEQVIMNLVVNAGDAMPHGGRLTIDARNVVLEDTSQWTHQADPGEYVMFSVMDTGVGMDATTSGQIFDPFFTTKVLGKGTGLGLSTVHGIVGTAGGTLQVQSEPGRGTTFSVYLPKQSSDESWAGGTSSTEPVARGTERVLVVEDDDALRRLVVMSLEESGYLVSGAEHAEAALARFDAGEQFELVLSDVIMPGANGPELVAELQRHSPGLRTLLMSGYTNDALDRNPQDTQNPISLRKPFSMEELGIVIRRALDEQNG